MDKSRNVPAEEKLPDDINDVLTELDDYYEDYQRNPKYDNPYTYHGETSLEKEMSVNHVDIGNFFKMVIECVSDREAYIENMESIEKMHHPYVVILPNYMVYSQDFDTLIGSHISSGADIRMPCCF